MLSNEITGRYDFYEKFDPRVAPGWNAAKGSTWRYVPTVGSAVLLQKQDNGLSTNWTDVGTSGGNVVGVSDEGVSVVANAATLNFVGAGVTAAAGAPGVATITIPGGGLPTGTVSTMSFFNTLGNLDSVLGSAIKGFAPVGTVTASGDGSNARGRVVGASSLLATGAGSTAYGRADLGVISATNNGSFAFGLVESALTASISSTGQGALAFGYAGGANAHIFSNTSGALAFGIASVGGQIIAASTGLAFGGTSQTSALITVTATGALAHGNAVGVSNGGLTASGIASHIMANVVDYNATASGEVSHVKCTNISAGRAILASGALSTAIASQNGGGLFDLTASGEHSWAQGKIDTGSVTASGLGSAAIGDDLLCSGTWAEARGIGHVNQNFLHTVFGRYSVTPPNAPTTWNPTDPLFVLGNGSGTGTRRNAFKIDKDGRSTTSASEVNSGIQTVIAADNISARATRRVLCDLAGATGNLQLPAGEEGLIFTFSPKGAGGAVYTLVPNGGETLDASVTATIQTGMTSALTIVFSGSTWYLG